MELAAFTISILALVVSTAVGVRAVILSRQANAIPTLVDLFREHRKARLASARRFVYTDLATMDVTNGVAGLPEEQQELVRELGCYYDNLGALVAHGVVDLDIVAGYMGSSVVSIWDKMEPLVIAEHLTRKVITYDELRWQRYFENLAVLTRNRTPAAARSNQRLWCIPD